MLGRFIAVLVLGIFENGFSEELHTMHHDYATLWDNPKCPRFDFHNHPSWNFLPIDECGMPSEKTMLNNRIFGGAQVVPGQFPWLALLKFKEKLSHVKGRTEEVTFPTVTSTGTLISKYYVLTCAHCFYTFRHGNRYTLSSVIFGSMLEEPGLEVPVEKYYSFLYRFHPPQDRNDIGIILLQYPVEFTENIRPICLPFGDILQHPEKYIVPDTFITIAGRGAYNSSLDSEGIMQDIYGDNILFADILIRDIGVCQNIYFRQRDTSEICAGEQHVKNFCTGDSGAPGVKQISLNGAYPRAFILGIVSTIASCGGVPGHLANVICYMKWILDHIEK